MTDRDRTVEEVGEFGLIDRLDVDLGGRTGQVVRGVGDDTAVVRLAPGKDLLATCDVQIEGVHFLRHLTTPEGIGWKAIVVNVSDVAAMAGRPRFALVSLGLPPTTSESFVLGIYDGIRAAADAYQIDVIGGNVARSPERVVVDVTVLGEVASDAAIYRRGARPGDLVMITGHPGQSAAGLALLTTPGVVVTEPTRERLGLAHLRPRARVAEAQVAAATGSLRALIDLSDGLGPDLGHICEESQCGAVIEAARLPISPALREAAVALGRDPVDLAVGGGEDYELLMVVAPTAATDVARVVEEATGTRATVVGEIRPADEGMHLRRADGRLEPLHGPLFRHF